MDLSETRRRRLRQLITDRYDGIAAALATAIGRPPSVISRFFTEHKTNGRNIGEKLARHIERETGLPEYWLDQEQGKAEQVRAVYRVDEDTQRRLLELFDTLIEPQQADILERVEQYAKTNAAIRDESVDKLRPIRSRDLSRPVRGKPRRYHR